MKAFEKWRLKNCEDNCDIGVDSGPCHRCSGLGTKEDAWKAALEDLLNYIKKNNKNFKYRGTDIAKIKKHIKEELEQ